MEIDFEKVKGAASLPEDQFASLIYAVVLASGGSQAKALAAKANAGQLKKKLANADPQELQKLSQSLDPQLLKSILELLKGQGGYGG